MQRLTSLCSWVCHLKNVMQSAVGALHLGFLLHETKQEKSGHFVTTLHLHMNSQYFLCEWVKGCTLQLWLWRDFELQLTYIANLRTEIDQLNWLSGAHIWFWLGLVLLFACAYLPEACFGLRSPPTSKALIILALLCSSYLHKEHLGGCQPSFTSLFASQSTLIHPPLLLHFPQHPT